MRSERNISELQEKSAFIAKNYEQGQLEFAVVPDFLRDAALDEALKGITAVVHLASPLAIEVSLVTFLHWKNYVSEVDGDRAMIMKLRFCSLPSLWLPLFLLLLLRYPPFGE